MNAFLCFEISLRVLNTFLIELKNVLVPNFSLTTSLSLYEIKRGIEKVSHQIETVKNDHLIASAWESRPKDSG